MASNRTMDMALGRIKGRSSSKGDEQDDEAPDSEGYGSEESDDGDEEERDEKKSAFIDMCKAIKAGKYDEAYDLYQDLCEGM